MKNGSVSRQTTEYKGSTVKSSNLTRFLFPSADQNQRNFSWLQEFRDISELVAQFNGTEKLFLGKQIWE